MPLFSVYDSNTGQITHLLDGPLATAQTYDNYLEGHFDPDEYVVIDGVATAKSDAEIEAKRKADALVEMKVRRNNILITTDWTQLSDNPLTTEQRQAWATYRQALRDLPANTTDPRNPTWPTKPE